jgi:hypothetical protein
MTGVLFPAGAKDFSPLSSAFNPVLDITQYPMQLARRPEREANYPSSVTAKVKNGGSVPPVFQDSSWRSA